MIIIGLLLLIAAVIFGGDLIFTNHHHFANPTVFGQSLGLTNDAALFIVGAFTGAAVLLGITLIMSGTRHGAVKARKRRHERKVAQGTRGERDDLAEKNERLRADLAKERERATAASSSDAHS